MRSKPASGPRVLLLHNITFVVPEEELGLWKAMLLGPTADIAWVTAPPLGPLQSFSVIISRGASRALMGLPLNCTSPCPSMGSIDSSVRLSSCLVNCVLPLPQGASVTADGSLLIENMLGAGSLWQALNFTIAGGSFDTVLPRMLAWRGEQKLLGFATVVLLLYTVHVPAFHNSFQSFHYLAGSFASELLLPGEVLQSFPLAEVTPLNVSIPLATFSIRRPTGLQGPLPVNLTHFVLAKSLALNATSAGTMRAPVLLQSSAVFVGDPVASKRTILDFAGLSSMPDASGKFTGLSWKGVH